MRCYFDGSRLHKKENHNIFTEKCIVLLSIANRLKGEEREGIKQPNKQTNNRKGNQREKEAASDLNNKYIKKRRWMSPEYRVNASFGWTVGIGSVCMHKFTKCNTNVRSFRDNAGIEQSVHTATHKYEGDLLLVLVLVLIYCCSHSFVQLFRSRFHAVCRPFYGRCFCICKTFQTFRSHLIIPCCFELCFFYDFLISSRFFHHICWLVSFHFSSFSLSLSIYSSVSFVC